MKYLFTLITLFIIGSLLGYLVEVTYRRFVTDKKWVNTGFMFGPYLPIYGFGTIILYSISNLISVSINVPIVIKIIVVIVTFFILLTTLEYLTGLLFLKKLNLRLWDYSDYKFNVKGIICPRYSLYWTIIGVSYYYLLHPLFILLINASQEILIMRVILFSILIIMLIDAYNIFNISKKLYSLKTAIYNEVNLITSYYSFN